MKRKCRVLIEDEQSLIRIKLRQMKLIRRAVDKTLGYEGFTRDAEVSVVITDNETIRDINKEYRNIDSPTDVLSFPQYSPGEEYPPTGFVTLGDIIISAERAENQAMIFGHPFERELAFLTVHSTLHLLGYDHETSREDELDMRRRQHEIMDLLGLHVNSEPEKESD